MKIERIETILVDIPTTRTHDLAFAALDVQNYVIVRVFADGLVGLGEASTIGGPAWADESPEAIKITVDSYLAPQLIGQDARDLNPRSRSRAGPAPTCSRSGSPDHLVGPQQDRLGNRDAKSSCSLEVHYELIMRWLLHG